MFSFSKYFIASNVQEYWMQNINNDYIFKTHPKKNKGFLQAYPGISYGSLSKALVILFFKRRF